MNLCLLSQLSVSAEQTHMIDADWIYQKKKATPSCVYITTCQLDLGVKYHVTKTS